MSIILLAVCVFVVASERVGACNPGCINDECFYNGHCILGCKPGYHGDICNKRCPRQCYSCYRYFGTLKFCTTCNAGFHGSMCELDCPEHCNANLCNINNGECSNGCNDGYSGGKCESCGTQYYIDNSQCHKCPKNCVSCSSYKNCHTCRIGYHGINCGYTCSPGCPNNNCFKLDGKCTNNYCNIGYRGDKCDKCVTGWYRDHTRCIQCQINCVSCRSHYDCTSCKAGYYGKYCEKSCSFGCKNGVCEKFDGSCKCKEEFTGNRCHQCLNGTFGANCDKDCPHKCVSCSSARVCGVCETGFYGLACELQCSEGCVDACDKITGFCTVCKDGFLSLGITGKCIKKHCANGTNDQTCPEDCERGYWGKDCTRQCVPNCEECDRYNGTCNVCFNGKYLRNCTGKCCDRCIQTENSTKCEIEDGSCTFGCSRNAFQGDWCQLDCNCTCEGRQCEWKTGKCSDGCIIGYYGEWCERMCSDNCISIDGYSGCYSSNGTCIIGCYNGYFGQGCQKQCGTSCVNGVCSRDTGDCILGCVEGFEGSNCAKANEKSRPGISTGAIGASTGGLSILILIAVVATAIICVRRKRTPLKREINLPSSREIMQVEIRAISHDIPTEHEYHTLENKGYEDSGVHTYEILQTEGRYHAYGRIETEPGILHEGLQTEARVHTFDCKDIEHRTDAHQNSHAERRDRICNNKDTKEPPAKYCDTIIAELLANDNDSVQAERHANDNDANGHAHYYHTLRKESILSNTKES